MDLLKLNPFKKKSRESQLPVQLEKRANDVLTLLLSTTEFEFTPNELALVFCSVESKLERHLEDQASIELNNSKVAKETALQFQQAQQIIKHG